MNQKFSKLLLITLFLAILITWLTSIFFKDFEATNIPLGSCPKCISGFVKYGTPFVSFVRTNYFGERGEGIGTSRVLPAATLILNFLIYFVISFIIVLTTLWLVAKLKKLRLFTSRNFILIEFILLALYEVSRLIARYELLAGICGGYPSCPSCVYVKPPTSCSDIFGGVGRSFFLLLFIIYLISFVIYRIVRKDFRNAILPVIIVAAAIFIVDWIVLMVL